METIVSSSTDDVIIAGDRPTVLIGERINPTGRKKLADALMQGDISMVQQEAEAQVWAGADILDINVKASGVDEVAMLPRAVEAVLEVVDVPLCLDSDNPEALAAALKVCRGRPIINSVTGREDSLEKVLPLVREYGTAVIGLTRDDDGVPGSVDGRLAIAGRIIERAEKLGIACQDVIIDCVTSPLAIDTGSADITLEAVRRVREEFGVNQTLGISNVSYGLPDRDIINNTFLVAAIMAGVTCPTVNVATARATVLATDVLTGRDRFAVRYIRACRQGTA